MNYTELLNCMQSDKVEAEQDYMSSQNDKDLFRVSGVDIALDRLYQGIQPFTDTSGGVR